MSEQEPAASEDELLAWLAAYDDALAGGTASSLPRTGEPSPDLRPRLERAVGCLDLLQYLRPSRRPVLDLPSADPPLTRLGRFQVLEELGRGTFGIVHRAYDSQLEREVALKIPRAAALAAPELRERFQREARAAAGLDHPNIVPVYDAGQEGALCYIASAYYPGPSLAAWLKQRTEAVPYRQAALLVAQLAEAVHHAHGRGVLHRDLKPGNVILSPLPPRPEREPGPEEELGFIPRVTDFGLAKLLDTKPDEAGAAGRGYETQSGVLIGTPNYMAPEQAGGDPKKVGTPADIHALGAIQYELLIGRPPFLGESVLDTLEQVRSLEPVPPRRLRLKLPRDLDTICLRCLQKEPAKRYASAAALADDLRRFLAGQPIHARPVAAWERAVKWAKRRPGVAAMLGLVLLVTAAGFGSTFVQWLQAEAAKDQAQSALAQTETHLYAACIALAQREWEGREIQRMLTVLDRCPPSLRHWEWHYLKALCHSDLLTLEGHTDGVSAATISPDGRQLASASLDGTVKLWDAAAGKEFHTLRPGAGPVYSVAFSTDSKYLASGHEDGTVKLWDPMAGQEVRTLHGHSQRVRGVAFSNDGKHCASASADRSVKVWEVASGQEILALRGHSKEVTSVAFSPTGKHVASASLDKTVKLWDAADGHEVWTGTVPDEVLSVAFSPDGQHLASAGEYRGITLWETTTGREVRTTDLLSMVSAASPSAPTESAWPRRAATGR